ncbi:acyltransferase [Haloarcula halophila]|uniref:acyltransferase n=1 Tax=Halomicroarcula sp. GCM10025335 TaxID=3252668 RepID=UPI00361977F2
MTPDIEDSARVVDSEVGDSEIREYVTIHDSGVGDDCQIYERVSIKKSTISDCVDINAGSYIENAEIGPNVQIAPNSNVVGVTHELTEQGMEFRNDMFERVILQKGAFVGAGAVVGPGVEVGEQSVVAAGATVSRDIGRKKLVLGSPPSQRIIDIEDWLNR